MLSRPTNTTPVPVYLMPMRGCLYLVLLAVAGLQNCSASNLHISKRDIYHTTNCTMTLAMCKDCLYTHNNFLETTHVSKTETATLGAGGRQELLGVGDVDDEKAVGACNVDDEKAVGACNVDDEKAVGVGNVDDEKAVGAGNMDDKKAVGAGNVDDEKAVGAGNVDDEKAVGAGNVDDENSKRNWRTKTKCVNKPTAHARLRFRPISERFATSIATTALCCWIKYV